MRNTPSRASEAVLTIGEVLEQGSHAEEIEALKVKINSRRTRTRSPPVPFDQTKRLVELRLQEEIYHLTSARHMREAAQYEKLSQVRTSAAFVQGALLPVGSSDSDEDDYYDREPDVSVRFGLKLSLDVSLCSKPMKAADLEAQLQSGTQQRSIEEATTLIRVGDASRVAMLSHR